MLDINEIIRKYNMLLNDKRDIDNEIEHLKSLIKEIMIVDKVNRVGDSEFVFEKIQERTQKRIDKEAVENYCEENNIDEEIFFKEVKVREHLRFGKVNADKMFKKK